LQRVAGEDVAGFEASVDALVKGFTESGDHLNLDELLRVRDADDLTDIPAHVLSHLDACEFCQTFQASMDPVDDEVRQFVAEAGRLIDPLPERAAAAAVLPDVRFGLLHAAMTGGAYTYDHGAIRASGFRHMRAFEGLRSGGGDETHGDAGIRGLTGALALPSRGAVVHGTYAAGDGQKVPMGTSGVGDRADE
jgi:hypothetical protein